MIRNVRSSFQLCIIFAYTKRRVTMQIIIFSLLLLVRILSKAKHKSHNKMYIKKILDRDDII